jgi:hypothetical protein
MPEGLTPLDSSSKKCVPERAIQSIDDVPLSMGKTLAHELRNKIQAQMLIVDVSLSRIEEIDLSTLRDYLQKMRKLAEEMIPYIDRIPE